MSNDTLLFVFPSSGGHLRDRPKIWGKDPYRSIHNKVESIQYFCSMHVVMFVTQKHSRLYAPPIYTPLTRLYAPLNLPLRV